jgi:hypothetical protein
MQVQLQALAANWENHRGGPARERTGPEPLRRTDNDLDFDAKDHHDQQQEEQISSHVCASSDEPAGPIPRRLLNSHCQT